ncbi:MAG TPA: biotin/lipoyl-containing protein, partial [Puia sp.]|nr:biotin/lipoyl-containing protein [Puia sp.]
MIDIKVPAVGESISEVTLVKWLKQQGQYVERDEVIAELESEKATFEVNAEKAGVLNTVGKEGDTLKIGDVVARIDEAAARPEGQTPPAAGANGAPQTDARPQQPASSTAAPSAPAAPSATAAPAAQQPASPAPSDIKATPVAAAIISDKKIDANSITPTGTGGKIVKNDVLEA